MVSLYSLCHPVCVNCFEMSNFSRQKWKDRWCCTKMMCDSFGCVWGEKFNATWTSVEDVVLDVYGSIRSSVYVQHQQIDDAGMVSYLAVDAKPLHSSRTALDRTLAYRTENEMKRNSLGNGKQAQNENRTKKLNRQTYMVPVFLFVVIVLLNHHLAWPSWLTLLFSYRLCGLRTTACAHRTHVTIKVSTRWTFNLVSLEIWTLNWYGNFNEKHWFSPI